MRAVNLAILASLLVSNSALASFPMPDLITEDYAYACTFRVSTQINENNTVQFCQYNGSKTLTRSDATDEIYESITVYPNDLNLVLKSYGEGCAKKPFILNDNTFFSLRISKHNGGMHAGKYVANASIRVASPESKLLTASTSSGFPFKFGYLQVSADLTTESKVFVYAAECKLLKPKRKK